LQAPALPTALSGVRSEVASRAAAAAGAPTEADTFDDRNEITRNPDGTLGTKRSQVLGNARQLREDVNTIRDNARDLIADGSSQALITAEEARARNSQSQRARDIDATSDVPTLLPSSGKRSRK
jgi:conjugal transfer mating pair stabilization protein TraG